MSNPPLSSLPALPESGVATLLRALFKRASARPSQAPATTYRLDRIDIDHVRRYTAAFGLPGDEVPLTYLYLLAQRAQLAAMLARPTPFRIAGLIHVENRLALHRAIRPGAPLTLSTALSLPPPAANGALHCVLETRAFDGDEPVFSCDSTYLIKRGQRGAAPRQVALPENDVGSWTLARDAGRRYAALSGDWNPIHLWRWTARLMGMRAPIIHGMHTVAQACALYRQATGMAAREVQCRFTGAAPLGTTLTMFLGPSAQRFVVMCNGRTAVEGSIHASSQ